MSANSFWNPKKPQREYSHDFYPKAFCYKVGAISFVASCAIALLYYFNAGWISAVYHQKWDWWVYLLIIPAAPLVCFLGSYSFVWIAIIDASYGYLFHDTWRWAEKISPSKPGIALRTLQLFQLFLIAPIVIGIIAGRTVSH